MRGIIEVLLDKPIAVNPILIKLTDSFSGAILLSQAIYWEKTMGREFWKTNEEWQRELHMSEQEFTTARRKCADFLNVDLRGMPAKNHYSIKWDQLERAILSVTLETGVTSYPRNWGNKLPEKLGEQDTLETGVTYNTETTTETTTDIHTPIFQSAGSKKPPKAKRVYQFRNTEGTINLVIGLFKLVNDDFESFYQLPKMREACDTLLRRHKMPEIESMIEKAVTYNKLPYIASKDRIYTPHELLKNWSKCADKEVEYNLKEKMQKRDVDEKLKNRVVC